MRHSGLEASLGDVQTETQPDVGNVKDGSSDHTFYLLALFSVISNCSSTMDVGFVKLSSDCFCGNGLQDEH